jgi:hypothetical protein
MMADSSDEIPKINPNDVEQLIEKFEQNRLNEQEKKLITGLLRTLCHGKPRYFNHLFQARAAEIAQLADPAFALCPFGGPSCVKSADRLTSVAVQIFSTEDPNDDADSNRSLQS